MKSYCILYSKKDRETKKLLELISKSKNAKKYNLHKIIYHSLDDKIVPPYANRIDETFFTKDKTSDEGAVLFINDNIARNLESKLEEYFVRDKIEEQGDYEIHRKAIDSLRNRKDLLLPGLSLLSASTSLDAGFTLYNSITCSNCLEANPFFWLFSDFFNCENYHGALASYIAITTAFSYAFVLSYAKIKHNNVVTDGVNTYFYRKPSYNASFLMMSLFSISHFIGFGSNLAPILSDFAF